MLDERHVRVTVYMPPGMVADLDALRADMLRRSGINVDRGRLIRAAVLLGMDDPEKLEDRAEEEG